MDDLTKLHLQAAHVRISMVLNWDKSDDHNRQVMCNNLDQLLEEIRKLESQSYQPQSDAQALAWAANDAVQGIAYGNLDQLDWCQEETSYSHRLMDNGMVEKLLELYTEQSN